MRRIGALLTIGFLATGLSTGPLAMAQAPGLAPAQPRTGGLDVADHRDAAPPPIRGVDSKRWESWSAMRTAADPLLGWKIGMRSTAFPGASLTRLWKKQTP